ncbi:unnamed protein product, partial [Closterium sp. Naga37s-1]
NHAEVARLLQEGSDPTERDGRGRVAYAVAANKATRDAFRRHMAAHAEQWDWHAAAVPSALTHELQASQAARQAEKEAKKKAKEKERRQRKKQEERERKQQALHESAPPAPSPTPSPAETEEQRRAREREERAAAAERRVQQLAAGTAAPATAHHASPATTAAGSCCDSCGASLAGRTPFSRLAFNYCTTACVRAHKTILDTL